MLEATEITEQVNTELTAKDRSDLITVFDFIANRFPWLAKKVIYAIASGVVLLGVGGAGVASAQEASNGGAGGSNTNEQVGVEVAQAFPRLGMVNGEVNVRSSAGQENNSNIIRTLSAGEQFSVLGTDASGEWYEIQFDDGSRGFVFKDLVVLVTPQVDAAPEALASVNATATAEAPLQISVVLPDGSTVTATATPTPEVPEANTPPNTVRVYETQDKTTKFFLTIGDRTDSPRFRKVGDGPIEDLHAESGRNAVDALLPEGFWEAYPNAVWSVDMHMYQLPDGRFVVPGLGENPSQDIESATQNFSMDMQSPDFVEGQSGYRLIVTLSDHQISYGSYSSKMSDESEQILLGIFSSSQLSVIPGTTIVANIAPGDDYANARSLQARFNENGDTIMATRSGSVFASGSNRGGSHVMHVRVEISDAVRTAQGNTGWGVSVITAIAAELHYFKSGNYDPNFKPDEFVEPYFGQIWQTEGYTYDEKEPQDYFFGF